MQRKKDKVRSYLPKLSPFPSDWIILSILRNTRYLWSGAMFHLCYQKAWCEISVMFDRANIANCKQQTNDNILRSILIMRTVLLHLL